MKTINKAILGLALTAVGLFWLGNANAVPSFAAKYDKKCSYCHTAWPQLNKKGRDFKERGYRLKEDLKDTSPRAPYSEQGTFPISAMLISRPYDKKDSGEAKVRAIHEAEIFIAGTINKEISGFFEIEAEDETGFEPELGSIALSYRFNDYANVQAVWGPAFWYDGYGLLGDHFRMTRGHVPLIDQAFGGADGDNGLRGSRQSLNFTGRGGPVFYGLGVANGVAGDPEGEEPTVGGHAKVAFDIKDIATIGLFGLAGEDPATNREYTRTGIDFQGDFADARVQAAYVAATDDNATNTAEDENSAMTLQGFYTFKTKEGKPTFVPLVRFDSYEQNDGNDEYQELTLNVTYYLKENVKAYVEYWNQMDAPDGVDKDSRVTLQAYVGF
jgi:hypothetical protein